MITNKLFEYFPHSNNPTTSEHIARVVLLWVNNHFNDFESNLKLYEFLEKFNDHLQHHPTDVKSYNLFIVQQF